MYCTNCGVLIRNNELICPNCGELHNEIVDKKQSELQKFIDISENEHS